MSLKSKLEAVIYAAEEPVTLTQLATLFAGEALELKTAQEAEIAQGAAADAAAIVVDPSQPVIAEGLEYLELRTEDGSLLEQPGFAVLPAAEPESAAEPQSEAGRDAGLQTEVDPATLPTEGSRSESNPAGVVDSQIADNAEEAPAAADTPENPAAEAAQLDPEAEAKRTSRQRDRDIKAVLRQIIEELIAEYANDDRGIEIREIAGGYRMATKPECHDAVRMFIKSLKPPLKLSLPALETLAVIAYKQPVTAPEVNEIRGVDSSGVFGSLLARKLITTAGRKQVIGRPILYKTTKEFLMRFGLKDVSELPSMDEFEKMASELEEAEPTQLTDPESADSYDAEGSAGPELDENAPEEPDNDSPSPGEDSSHTPAPASESNEKTEPAE